MKEDWKFQYKAGELTEAARTRLKFYEGRSHRRMEPYEGMHTNLSGGSTPERYDLCASVMLGILEPAVSLHVQADEYEETMQAQDIIDGLSNSHQC